MLNDIFLIKYFKIILNEGKSAGQTSCLFLLICNGGWEMLKIFNFFCFLVEDLAYKNKPPKRIKSDN